MWLTVLLLLVLLLLVYLLLAPLRLVVDTSTNTYMFSLPGIFQVSVESHNTELIRLRLKLFVFKFYLYPLRRPSRSPKNKVRNSSHKTRTMSLKRAIRLLKSFTLEKLFINIDTGNYVTNAKLYALYGVLNYKREYFQINFQGKNQLAITLKNRPINLIKSFINF